MDATKFVSILLAASLAACAGQPAQQPRLYSISLSTAPQARALATSRVQVTLPAYVDRAMLVVQDSPNTLHRARGHRWAEPLSNGIARRLSAALGAAQHIEHLAVDITMFHGTLNGDVYLKAAWQATSSCNTTTADFAASGVQPSDGYEPMVRALGMLLDQFAADVATQESLRC